jgi:hypothetical protein
MSSKNRFKALSIWVFGITVAGVIFVHDHLNREIHALFGEYASLALVAFSLLSYDLLFKLSISAIEKIGFMKKLYWGALYFDGLWDYTSHSVDGEEFFGIWRIDQDILGVKVVAFGLDKDFHRRSTVKSVSDVLGENGVFKVVNERWDLSEGVREQLSRTVLVPDKSVRHGLFSYPDIIRGETTIYGGVADSFIAFDLRMKRRDDCKTEDILIGKLRKERLVRAGGTPAHKVLDSGSALPG